MQDGGKAPRLALNDGNTIPAMGMGLYLGKDEQDAEFKDGEEDENEVTVALNAGYRLFDTSQLYDSEEKIADGIQSTGVSRENVFIAIKLANYRRREVVPALKDFLNKMNTPYVDLYLFNLPRSLAKDKNTSDVIDYLDTWKDMEEAKELGLAKSIGICNFNMSQIERLLAHCQVKPAVLQVEVNLNVAQDELIQFCKQHDILVMADTPFAYMYDTTFKREDAPELKADDPVLVEIAEKHGKTVAQIVLRFLVQKGVIPHPMSNTKERLEDNIAIFDFELTTEDMSTLQKFNKNYRLNLPSFWQNVPFYPFDRDDWPDLDETLSEQE